LEKKTGIETSDHLSGIITVTSIPGWEVSEWSDYQFSQSEYQLQSTDLAQVIEQLKQYVKH